MPFDGAEKIAPEVEVLDKMRVLFGPKGERWIRGASRELMRDGSIGFCMAGALAEVTFPSSPAIERVRDLLNLTVPYYGGTIVSNNDLPSMTFDQIEAWLGRARAKAVEQQGGK